MYLYMKKAQEARRNPAGAGTSQFMTKFEITVAPPKRSGFYPRDTVSGEVMFTTSAGPQEKGLKLQLIGAEKVNWFEEKQHSGKRFSTVEFSSRPVPGTPGMSKFKVTLPPKLPQSYNGKYGSIMYWIEPVFPEWVLTSVCVSSTFGGKMSLKERNEFLKKYRKTIKIEPYFDLSAYPALHQPMSVMKDNSGMFTNKNLIEVLLSLPKLGYVPNETIEFKIHIINGSDKSITSSAVTLIQEAKFRAGPVNRDSVKTFFEEVGPQLSPKSCQVWNGTIKIPSRVSPISTRCSFILVEYFLRASVTSTGFMETVEVKVPIVIGTVSTRGVPSEIASTKKRLLEPSSSMDSIATQISYCSHGYLDRTTCDELDKLPDYASLSAAAATSNAVKTNDDWETMSYSSLPDYDDLSKIVAAGPSAGGRQRI